MTINPTIIPTISTVLYEKIQLRKRSEYTNIWSLLDNVYDPEIPVLSVWDIGILQNIEFDGDDYLIIITPTYSGCPAVDAIKEDIAKELQDNQIYNYQIKTRLSPAWTTDSMTLEGINKLRAYGIAPPTDVLDGCALHITPTENILCPQCNSRNTHIISEFGSTACKALFKCHDCQEPFDFFKCI
jgi:ring-1,2-phenylacetyl-CoA epoxidase subunit PaaD